MEQGVLTYLKEKNYTIGGRKVDFVSADTGGNGRPAPSRVPIWWPRSISRRHTP